MPGIQQNGGGGGGGHGGRGAAPPRYIPGSELSPDAKVLTDLDIITMEPGKLLTLYYTQLLQYKLLPPPTCAELVPNPELSAGLNLVFAELHERNLRERIYQLRADLRYITTKDGKVPGLVDLQDVNPAPGCGPPTLVQTIGQWIMTIASGVLLGPGGIIISVINTVRTAATLALEIGAKMRAAEAALKLRDQVMQGVYGIAAAVHRARLFGGYNPLMPNFVMPEFRPY